MPRERSTESASLLVLLAVVSAQCGSASAKWLVSAVGARAAVFLRTGISVPVMWLFARGRVGEATLREKGTAAALGLVTMVMNLCFYTALQRLPLGTTVTIEFLGPLGVAIAHSRKKIDFLWTGLAGLGFVLLARPGSLSGIDHVGVVFACVAAVGWAGYILLTAHVGKRLAGTAGLALATSVGAVVICPFALYSGGATLLDHSIVARGVLVAMLSTAIPYGLEFVALKRLRAHTFSILLSTEPAVAAVAGLVLLHEGLGLREVFAIGLVTLASLGATR